MFTGGTTIEAVRSAVLVHQEYGRDLFLLLNKFAFGHGGGHHGCCFSRKNKFPTGGVMVQKLVPKPLVIV